MNEFALLDELEARMHERYPDFIWTSTHGSGEHVFYSLKSAGLGVWLTLDAELNEVTRDSIAAVAKRASYLDAMETED